MTLSFVRIALLFLIGLAATADGFRGAFVEQYAIGDALLRWTMLWSVASLCLVDSSIRGKRVPLCAGWMFLLVPHFSVFAYAVWSRGWRGFLLAIGLFTLIVVATLVGHWIGLESLYE